MPEKETLPFYEVPEDDLERFLKNACLYYSSGKNDMLPVEKKELDISKFPDGIHLVACGGSGYELKNPQVHVGVINKKVQAVSCSSFREQEQGGGKCSLGKKECPHADKKFVTSIKELLNI